MFANLSTGSPSSCDAWNPTYLLFNYCCETPGVFRYMMHVGRNLKPAFDLIYRNATSGITLATFHVPFISSNFEDLEWEWCENNWFNVRTFGAEGTSSCTRKRGLPRGHATLWQGQSLARIVNLIFIAGEVIGDGVGDLKRDQKQFSAKVLGERMWKKSPDCVAWAPLDVTIAGNRILPLAAVVFRASLALEFLAWQYPAERLKSSIGCP